MDAQKQEQPPQTYPYGKNGIWFRNAIRNEPGFSFSSVNIPYTHMGTIETDTYPIVFSTDNTNSAYGFFDVDKDVYTPIDNDSAKAYKYNFNTEYPIKGEARRNYKNDIEVAWFDRLNSPKFANTNELGTTINDFQLFPQSVPPKVTLTMNAGGNLGMGSYAVAIKYLKKDGTATPYSTLSSPLIATSDNWSTIPGSNTGKALTIDLTEVDTRFDTMIIAIVQSQNNILVAYELPELPVAATVSFIYTGSEIFQQITLDEVLTPAGFYENVGAMTQLNDQLFMANVKEEADIDWQKYANLVQIRWKSELATVVASPNIPLTSGKQRGFMHEEVYCFYMVLKLNNGRNSQAFIIPGPAPQGSDLTQATVATAQGLPNAPNYQIENTCRNVNTSDQTGDCGVWINQDERYPDIEEFDSSTIGGPNLRNQLVRHHKMPSIRWCRSNLYAGNLNYGRTVLDSLGLQVSNVQIPVELVDRVVGWEVHYAKRDYNNATVLGQSLLLFGAQSQANITAGLKTNVTSTGGTWGSWQRTEGYGAKNNPESLLIVPDFVRFHAFDLLNNKPSISPTHFSLQYSLVARWNAGLDTPRNDAGLVIFNMDYPNSGTPGTVADDQHIKKLTNGQYVANNVISGPFNNTRLEAAYAAQIPQPGNIMTNLGWGWNKRDYRNGNNDITPFELTYLTNLMILRRNVYLSYYSQTLVRTGVVTNASQQSSSGIIYGGDTFLSNYSFVTYGLVTAKDVVEDTGNPYWNTTAAGGIKTNHKFICESVADIAARYQIPGNLYSAFWPQTTTDGTPPGSGFIGDFSRNVEPNQIGYSKDCNAVGDQLNGITIASPFDTFVEKSPYKIIRSLKQLREGKTNSWKNYAALDYFETIKDKGEIENLQGMGEFLIIHHQNAIYRTRDKEVLKTDISTITLGSGDIFAIEPKEAKPAKLGYGGTQHSLACVLLPVGYIFPDAKTGELFLFTGDELLNIGEGIERFLRKYLTTVYNNPYIGNGITIGYDQFYKRIIITCKNQVLAMYKANFVPGYENTTEFFATLIPGTSIVYRRGRYQLFMGENSTEYSCSFIPSPTLDDYNFESDEHVPNGTVIGTVAASGGTPGYYYAITGGNPENIFVIDPATGIITVGNTAAMDYTLSPIEVEVTVTDDTGRTATGTVTVDLTQVPSTPVIPPYTVNLDEHSANGTAVVDVNATDRDGKSITYSITGGNTGGAFTINPTTGVITVATTAVLDFFDNPSFILTVRATASDASYAENTVTINLNFVYQPPVPTNSTFEIADTTPDEIVIGSVTPATQRAGEGGELVYELDTDSFVPDAFIIDYDSESDDFLKISVLDNSKLDPADNNYVITVKVYNTSYSDVVVTFTITITVYYDPELLSSVGTTYTCLY